MLIFDPTTDPFFNLAADEFLLRETDEPVLRIWRSSPSVVIGRHQIPCVEANVVEAFHRGIPILRRISGGGAVYHDSNNINFTIVRPLAKGEGVDFANLLAPVAAVLNEMGLSVEYSGRGDLRLGGKKISGNSAYLWKGRILHHGTLLFDADLDVLEVLLNVRGEGWEGRSVRSVKSAVTNLAGLVSRYGTATDFADDFAGRLAPSLGINRFSARSFDEAERRGIAALSREKYETPAWNLGASPDYSLKRMWNGRTIFVPVCEGRVGKVEIEGDETLSESLACTLSGQWHDPGTIAAVLNEKSDGKDIASYRQSTPVDAESTWPDSEARVIPPPEAFFPAPG